MQKPQLIIPFRGLRYDPARLPDLSPVVSPPYDVISPEAETALARRHPENVVRLESVPPARGDHGGDAFAHIAATLAAWLASGVLIEDSEACLYPLEQSFTWRGRSRRQRGFLCLLRLASWEKKVVLPHESTLPRPKAERLDLLRACQAHFSPVLALYRDPAHAAANLEIWDRPPLAQGELDGVGLRLWSVEEGAQVQALQQAVGAGPVFIADGHHRYESALAFRDEMRLRHPDAPPNAGFNYLLVHLLEASDPGVAILPAHRLLSGLGRKRLESAWREFVQDFDLEPLPCRGRLPKQAADLLESRDERPAYGIYRGGGKLYLARAKDSALPTAPGATEGLDVNIAHRKLVLPLLAGGEGAVSYVTREEEALAAVDRGECQLALLLRATRVEQVLAAAEAGERMPGKSTYFYPKSPAGVVMASVGAESLQERVGEVAERPVSKERL